ncbi:MULTISPECIES: RagB/SusD family nutrient uptake outer membrane protein [unclassified Carboxylicivirga]|uniref:RagB/SusD family nutrient uptake outer membrane protein n=1 Tax=Carboxylicivirga TaxID=1628153 RepID=UPI003D33AF55
MKRLYKIILSCFLATMMVSCTLDEDPKFPSGQNLYQTIDGSNTVLNGCYASLASFNYYGADLLHLTYFSSGLYNSNRDATLLDIAALKASPSLNFVENVWQASYQAIGRTNDLITHLEDVNLNNPAEQDNILGQAYFIRGLVYFNLVRIYGGVPLITKNPTIETMNQPRATAESVYEQIIADLDSASVKMKEVGEQTPGRPAKGAANMLLAKVYMTLAGNKSADQTDYWQKAYNHAIKAYEKYSLVDDYHSLWIEATANNTVESVFEIQGNVENSLRLYQLFTPSNGNIGRSVWGRIKPNLECYDMHNERYTLTDEGGNVLSQDPRLAATFLSEWPKYNNAGQATNIKSYPFFTRRGNKDKSYPWLNKYYIKEHERASYDTNMNFVVMRYADLLLMLAEIENELNGPANAYQYVNQVLARARRSGEEAQSEPADWLGLTQEEFRAAIMFEYRYELLGEGHEWFNDRRRGYEYFKANVIDVHNNHGLYEFDNARDVLLPDDERNMLMPIPQSEITANPNISAADQNPGY